MSQQGSIWTRSTIANVVAGAIVLLGMGYAIYTNNTQLVTSIAMAGVGYLLGRTTSKS